MAVATTTTSADGWADLPSDLLVDVSRRLNEATDYVRFHAVCRPWRGTLPPPPRHPAFLPWLVTLVSPRDATGHRKVRCVFSRSPTLRVRTVAIPDTHLVIKSGDVVAARVVLNSARRPEPTSGVLRSLFGPSPGTCLPMLPRRGRFVAEPRHWNGLRRRHRPDLCRRL